MCPQPVPVGFFVLPVLPARARSKTEHSVAHFHAEAELFAFSPNHCSSQSAAVFPTGSLARHPACSEGGGLFLSLLWSNMVRLPACRLLLRQCLCPSLGGVGSLKNNEVYYELRDRRTERSRARGWDYWLFITSEPWAASLNILNDDYAACCTVYVERGHMVAIRDKSCRYKCLRKLAETYFVIKMSFICRCLCDGREEGDTESNRWMQTTRDTKGSAGKQLVLNITTHFLQPLKSVPSCSPEIDPPCSSLSLLAALSQLTCNTWKCLCGLNWI